MGDCRDRALRAQHQALCGAAQGGAAAHLLLACAFFKAQGASKSKVQTGLVEVRMPPPTARGAIPSTAPLWRIEIELLSGRRLSVSEAVDLERLGDLVALLERS